MHDSLRNIYQISSQLPQLKKALIPIAAFIYSSHRLLCRLCRCLHNKFLNCNFLLFILGINEAGETSAWPSSCATIFITFLSSASYILLPQVQSSTAYTMDRIPSDEALTETIKTLIISRKSPMTVTQLKQDYQELEGKTIPDAKLHSLMKYNAVFHHIQPYNGNAEERFDVRFDVRARMMSRQKSQKKFIPATMKNPVVPRNRYTVTINNNNVGQNDFNGDGPQPLMDLRQKLNRKDPPAPMPKLTMPLSERLKKRGQLSPEDIQAANAVKISELNQNPLDVSSDGEIVKKVWLMIRNSIGGVFVKHITSLFNETYKLSLPENWQQLVKQHESVLFNFETNAFNELIIFAIGDIDMTSSRPVEIGSSQQIAELIFPWELSLWNVFVTGVISTNDVSARLIGANYSDALDKLLNDIEIFMLTNKERPQEILLHHVYLTSIAECYHRIRVVEMSGESANCICIDNGDYEWIRFEDIYLCKPEFLVVAPQAFKLSLFGLEAFENDPNVAQQPLFEPLVFKSLIAEVMQDRKAYEFTKNKPIPSIVYDTSTEEDVNLNESLMNSILRSIPTPALHQKDNNQVLITKIGDDGIYCQLVKSAVHLQNQINNIPKDDLSKHRGMYTDKADKKKNYLAYDPKKKTWFRARLERYTEGDSQLMNFVDHGFKATVKVSDLYRLDKLSIVLFSYPAQVLKFGLFNVQMTGDVKKRLLALLPSGTQALVRFLIKSELRKFLL